MSKALVMGASGFLGSNIARELVAQGREVRLFMRDTSDSRATDDLEVERHYGDVSDRQSLLTAMSGCDTIFYCIVDTRAWLRDSGPLFRTNVDGLVHSMDAALQADIKRFIFTSSFVTVGLSDTGISDETIEFNWWQQAPDYMHSRVMAENKLLEYCRDKNLPGISCCVGNTYGAGDIAPTPHGQLVLDASVGKMPFYWEGGGPSVGITDAARAMILAEHKGRAGERYLISERWVSYQELFTLAAIAGKKKPPAVKLPKAVMYTMSAVADFVARLRGKESRMSIDSLKCASMVNDVDSSKARNELGWQPRPIEVSIEEAVSFYRKHSKDQAA